MEEEALDEEVVKGERSRMKQSEEEKQKGSKDGTNGKKEGRFRSRKFFQEGKKS